MIPSYEYSIFHTYQSYPYLRSCKIKFFKKWFINMIDT